jgi:hypothetical protein
MRVTVYFDLESETVEEGYEYEIVDYKTNGYGDLVSWPGSISGFITEYYNSYNTWYPVKGYKKVGVKIIPKKNIKRFRFQLQEFDTTDTEVDLYLSIEDVSDDFIDNNPVEIFYDFDTKLLSVKSVEN